MTDLQNRIRIAVQLSVGIVYYLRFSLDHDREFTGLTRSLFASEINKVMRSGDGIEEVMRKAISSFVTPVNFRIPKGVALTRALCENIFTLVACVISTVPLGIIGTPGSSKTLSVYIVRDNLRGNQAHTKFCRNLPPIDVIAHQCSEYSTSEEIRKTFQKAEKRQESYLGQTESSTRCLVFLDEAGLPKEKLMVLKIIHPFLDNPKISFVAISNFAFDAANTNRMVTLRRTLDRKDLEVLAQGCLGLTDIDNNSKVCQFAKGLAHGFRAVRMDLAFRKMFHYRDFIYTLLYIRWNYYMSTSSSLHEWSSVPSPTVVLNALEENMNGVGQQEFQRLFEIFFDGLQALVGRDYALSRDAVMRSETQTLSTMLNRSVDQSLTSGEKFGSRFVMIIDPADDETSTIRMLFDSGLLKHENEERQIRLLTLSDFDKDVASLGDTEALAKVRFALDTPCTAVLQNTSRIHGALYDLFNQTFSIMAEAKDGETNVAKEGEKKSVYATIAIGELTYPCRVDPNFKCVVVIQERELTSTPSPFLSRFSKFRLSAEDFLDLQLEGTSNVGYRNEICKVQSTVMEFLEHVGHDDLFGITNKHSIVSQIVLCYFFEEIHCSRKKSRSQAILDEKINSLLKNDTSRASDEDAEVSPVVSLCARLLQLAPPEIAILGLQNIVKTWRHVFVKIYFDIHDHFSLERLIGSLREGDCNDNLENSMIGNKLFVYCRSAQTIPQLCEHFDSHGDWRVFDGRSISSVDTVNDFLSKFIKDDSPNVALLIVPSQLARQLNKMRVILQLIDDAYEYINGNEPRGTLTMSNVNNSSVEKKNKSFVLMLPHDSDYECADAVHPAQFLDGWDTFFVDLLANDESNVFKTFVQETDSVDETQIVQRDASFIRASHFEKWSPKDCTKTLCQKLKLPDVHEGFESYLCGLSRTLHAANTTLEKKTKAMDEIMQLYPWLKQVIASRFCSIPTMKMAIPAIFTQLAVEVYAKDRRESLSSLVANALTLPYLMYVVGFMNQIASNFGISSILEWCCDANAQESVKTLLMIIPSSNAYEDLELLSFHHSFSSVRCNVYKPYRTPLLEVLADWLEGLILEKIENEEGEEGTVRSCQERIDTMPNVKTIVSVIEENSERMSQWVDDLIRWKVAVDGAIDVCNEVLRFGNEFVMTKCEKMTNGCSKFLFAFWTVHVHSRTLIYLLRSSRALHHLGLLGVIEFEDDEPHRREQTYWLQTLEVTNKALFNCQDKTKWMAAVSLILTAFPHISSFRSRELHAAMKLMLLLNSFLRISRDAVDNDFLLLVDSVTATSSKIYKLSKILQDLLAITRTSHFFLNNFKGVISEVLFWYMQYPSLGSRKQDTRLLENRFSHGFNLHGTDHGNVTVRLDKCTVSSLSKLYNVNKRNEALALEDTAILNSAASTELLTTQREALRQQASDSGCFVLSAILKEFSALKELRTTFLLLASLQKWIYEELPYYVDSVEETLQQVTDRILEDHCCSDEEKERVREGKQLIERATSMLISAFVSEDDGDIRPQLQLMPLKDCLKTDKDNSNGYLFEILHQLASVQVEIVRILERYIEEHNAEFDWTLLYGDPAFRYPTSLSQVTATEGSTLISIDESRFCSLVQYCSSDEHDAVTDFHKLERLVIQVFLGNTRNIDMSTLHHAVVFVALGETGSRMRSLRGSKEEKIKGIVEIWLSRLPKSNDSENEPKNEEVDLSVNECCLKFDQADDDYIRRLQPYRAARITLQDWADILDQYPNLSITETLRQKTAVGPSFAGSLLSRLSEEVKGKHRKRVLKLILKKESSIRAEMFKAKTKKSSTWWSPQINEKGDISLESDKTEVESGGESVQLSKRPLHKLWNTRVDYSLTETALAETAVDTNDVDESDSSLLSEEDAKEESLRDLESNASEIELTEDQEDEADIDDLIASYALKLWTEEECAAQALAQYFVSTVEVSQKTPISMEDLLTDGVNHVFEIYRSLRDEKAMTPKLLCRRCDVLKEMVANRMLTNTNSDQSGVRYANNVGLVLSDDELPSHESPHCSLFLVETTIDVEIQLQLWKDGTSPLTNFTFATLKREFSSQSTVCGLLAAVMWYAEKSCTEEPLDFSSVVLHDKDGIMIEDIALEVTALDTQLRSLYCTFGCPYMFRYEDSLSKLVTVLPTCFRQSLLTSCKPKLFTDMGDMDEHFLVWNCQVGTAIEDVTGKDIPVFVISRKAVFCVSLNFRDNGGSRKLMNLPLLYTSRPQSVCALTCRGDDEEKQVDIEQWQLHKVTTTETNKSLQRLVSIPLGWSCFDKDKLVVDVHPLLPKIQLNFQTEDTEDFIYEVVQQDGQEKPSTATLLDYFCETFPQSVSTNALCLIDVDSNIVLTDDDDLIDYARVRNQKVTTGNGDVASSCRLPIFCYSSVSNERSLQQEIISFMIYPSSENSTCWEMVRDFLAIRQSCVYRSSKGAFHCGSPPFLTFEDCDIIIDSYYDFQGLIKTDLKLAIGFWDELKPDDLIGMEVSYCGDQCFPFKVTYESAKSLIVQDLIKLLTKLKPALIWKRLSFLVLEGQEIPLSNSMKLSVVVERNDRPVKFCLQYSDTLNVGVAFDGSTKFIDMPCDITFNDAIHDALKLFDLERHFSDWKFYACNMLLKPSNEEVSFFQYLEECGIDENVKLEIEPQDDIVWVGRLGLQHLEMIEHSYVGTVDQFRMNAAKKLGLDFESCQLEAGDIRVSHSVRRLHKVLELCRSSQFCRKEKPIVYLFDSEHGETQSAEYESVSLQSLIRECAPTLWPEAECGLLSVRQGKVKVSTRPAVTPIEPLCTDNNRRCFTVTIRKMDDAHKPVVRRFYCSRSELEAKMINDDTPAEFILASEDGLASKAGETPQSGRFVMLEDKSMRKVKLNFRKFQESENDDWNYSSLYLGDDRVDGQKVAFIEERKVSSTCTIQTVTSMAVMLWNAHEGSTRSPPIVIHFGDGSVPDPSKMVADLSEAERSNLWCSVGCQHTITIMETTTTVVPDHLPFRILQNTCVDDFFVWPSYRMLIAKDQSSFRTVFVLPRSKKAVFLATVIKEDGAKQHLAVTATTKCRSVLQYLSAVNDGSSPCLKGLRIEGMASESRLLPPSLPLGHVQCPDGTLTLHLFDESYYGKNDALKSAEKKDLTVSRCLKEGCAATTQKPFGKCLVDPVTCCRLPYNRSDFPIVQSVKRRDNSMRSLNLRDVEIVQDEETVDIELDAYRYSRKRLPARRNTDTVKVSIRNRKSAIVEWQAVAAFVGSIVDITGKGPFNCARPPFLALKNCNSKSSLLMPNPQLVVENLIKLVETSEHYKLHVGFWEEVETAPLIAITVIQSYRPFVTTQFQALRSQVNKLTVEDVIEAVSLQTEESLSTCIVKHCDDHFKRNDSLSKAVKAQGLVDMVKCLCLKLEILEQVNVRVTFDCQHRNICRNEQVCVALSDKTDEIIKKSLTKFDVEHADPELFQLKFDREDSEEETFVESSDSFQTILKKLKLDASCEVSCTMKQKKTLQVKVQLNDEEILEERMEHPLFYTIQEFLDDRATHLKAKGLDSITIASDINMYVSHDSFDDPVWIVPSNERFDAMIEQLGIGNQKESITIIIELRDPK